MRRRALTAPARLLAVLAVVAGFLAATPAFAQATGQISGTVTSATGDAPLKEVEVVVYNEIEGVVTTAETADNGTYTVSGLPEAKYKVGFFTSNGDYAPQYYQDKSTLLAATTIEVKEGKTTAPINAALVATGEIEGTLTGEEGGGEVKLSEVEVEVFNTSHELEGTAQSNSEGAYTVPGLAAGSYVVEFLPPGRNEYAWQYYSGKYVFKEAKTVPVSAGGATKEINGKLARSAGVEGYVTDASSKTGMEGVQVQLYDVSEPDTFIAPVETSETGNYGVGNLAPGSYEVEFVPASGGYSTQFYKDKSTLAEATAITVTAGVTSTEINAALTAGGRITGTVTSKATSDPLGEVEVSVFNSGGELVGSAQTEADGAYSVLGLPNGEYRVEFLASTGSYARQYYKEKATLAEATEVKVSASTPASGVSAALASEGSITGTVTNASKADLQGIEVLVYGGAEELLTSAKTEPDGTYEVEGLAAGKYKVQFVSPSGEYFSQYYSDKAKFSEAKEVPVAAGASTKEVNAAMSAADGSISGTVTNAATSAPIEHVTVNVYRPGVGQVSAAESAANGTYTVTGLPAGSYQVEFSPPSGEYLTAYFGGGSTLAASTPVTVSAGATNSAINAALKTPGQISGTVTNATSKAAIAGVEVQVYDSEGNFVAFADSAANGTYTVSGLATGSYEVEFVPGAGYLGQYYNGAATPFEASKVPVTAGATTSPVNAALLSAGEISGTVTSAASKAGLPEVEVQVYDLADELIETALSTGTGTYTVPGLASGGYVVEFVPPSAGGYARQFYDGVSLFSEARGVEVTEGATKSGVNAELTASGEISGTVTAAVGKADLQNVEVQAYDANGTPLASAETAANGTYTISGLPVGEYEVEFLPQSGNYLAQFYNDKPTFAAASKVAVAAGADSSDVNAALAAGGQIEGTVYEPGGSVGAADVEATVYNASDEFVGSAVTAANGTYTVSSLAGGNYEVGFTALPADYTPGEYAPQYYKGAASLAEATAIIVVAGTPNTGINATLAAPGAISGKVTATVTNDALSGVVVKVYDVENNFVTSAETAASGEYTVSGLAAGSYEVEFVSAGYSSQYYKGVTLFSEATRVEVKDGATAPAINAALVKPGNIAGTVTSAAGGAKLQGVEVQVLSTAGAVVGSAQSAANGTYTVSGLPVGSYDVQFLATSGDYAPQYYNAKNLLSEASKVTVNPGATTSPVNAALLAGGQITGTVIEQGTKADLANIQVSVYDTADVRVATVETSATGTYTVTGLGSESYEVEFFAPSGNYLTQFYNGASSLHSATAVAVTAGATKSPINAEMAAAYGSLSGTVTNASSHAALEHVEIEVYDSDGTYVAAGETAANGTYTIAGLAPGEYEVQFLPSTGAYLKQYYKGKSSLGEATAVIVTPGSTTAAVNAELVVGGEISGTVTDAVTQAGLEHVEVKVYDSSDAYLARAETASNGEYTVSGLAPGSYEVGFADGAGYAPQFYSGKALISEATKVTVSAGETKGEIDAALVAGGSLSGTVTEASTKDPLAEVEVNVRDSSGTIIESEETSAEGTYTVSALPPGSYSVEFLTASGKYVVQYYEDASSLASATPVAVTAGNTSGEINAAMVLAAAPVNTEAPKVTVQGTLGAGAVLSCSTGVWTGEPPPTFAYVWLREGVAIANATSGSYTVQAADEGHSVVCEVTATNRLGHQHADSAALQVPAPPVNTEAPKVTVTGTLGVGATLTCATGTWTGSPAPTFTYVWLREGIAIAGASTDAYTIQKADEGHGLVCEVTATNIAGHQHASSAVTQIPAEAPVNTEVPKVTVTGTLGVGATLTCSTGAWSGAPEPTFTYAWLREGIAISGATASSYTVAAADQGHGLVCEVTATNIAGQAHASSAVTQIPAVSTGGGGGPGGGTETPPEVSLTGPITSKSGIVLVPLDCPATKVACQAALVEITIVEELRKGKLISVAAKHSAKHSSKLTKRTVVLGTLDVDMTAGEKETFKVSLNGAGEALLKKRGKLLVKVQVLAGTTTIATQNVTVTPPAKKHKKHKTHK